MVNWATAPFRKKNAIMDYDYSVLVALELQE